MILMKKTLDDIMTETLAELDGMGIDSDAGTVARLLLVIINKQTSGYYDTLDLNIAQAFVSDATGYFLDKIGMLLNCTRILGESDDNFRARITKQIQVVASANEMAIRLAALSVPGVQDVLMKKWTHGTGSFSIYVISDNPVTPQSILDAVQAAVDAVEGYGIRGEVFRPSLIPVEMKVRLLFDKSVTDTDQKLAISNAQTALKNYVNSRNAGDSLVMKDLEDQLYAVNSSITQVTIFYFRVNNRPALVVDQTCQWNQRFIESDKPNAIQVM